MKKDNKVSSFSKTQKGEHNAEEFFKHIEFPVTCTKFEFNETGEIVGSIKYAEGAVEDKMLEVAEYNNGKRTKATEYDNGKASKVKMYNEEGKVTSEEIVGLGICSVDTGSNSMAKSEMVV